MIADSPNYFTIVEEHFQRARGTGWFRLSPRDWDLLDRWKGAGVPVEAVLRGIDAVFEKRRKRQGQETVNSLAYCKPAVMVEAQAMARAGVGRPTQRPAAPFRIEQLREFIAGRVEALREAGQADLADSLAALNIDELFQDLEQLEQRLVAIEEKLLARLRGEVSDDWLSEARRSLDSELKPCRLKMTADQFAALERRLLDRRLMDEAKVPRLSLFYLA